MRNRLSKRLRIILAFLGVVLVIVGITNWLGGGLLRGLCENQIVNEIFSPDNGTKAVVFERSCGATTGFSTQVSLIKADNVLGDQGGNVFIADTDHGKAPSAPHGGPEVILTWLGDRALRVSHHKDARIFASVDKVGDIQIQFATFK